MRLSKIILATGLIIGCHITPLASAHACGDELPVSCGDPQDSAKALLERAAAALIRDKTEALAWFNEQSHDFRTVEHYVFCIATLGRIDAHPDAKLRGLDVNELVDANGFHFGAEMLSHAATSGIASVKYLRGAFMMPTQLPVKLSTNALATKSAASEITPIR